MSGLPTALARTLDASLWADLIGVPWVEGGRSAQHGLDCVGLVLEVCRRRGIEVGDPAQGDLGIASWDAVSWDALEPGDLVAFGRGAAADHIGIYVGRDRILHAQDTRAVEITRLAALLRAGVARFAARPPQGDAVATRTVREPSGPARADVATLALFPSPFAAPMEREWRTVLAGESIADALPAHWPAARTHVLGPAGRVPPERWASTLPFPGEQYTAILLPGTGVEGFLPSLIQSLPALAVHTAYGIGAYTTFLNALQPNLPGIGRQRENVSNPAFDLDGLRNTAAPYLPIATMYGEHRVAGNIIQAFFRADINDIPVLHMLVAPCAGPIESIAGVTAEADGLEGLAIPEAIELDGNPAKNFEGCRVALRLGENDQTSIPGFQENVSSQSVTATLLQLQPYEFTTTQTVDAFEVLVEFPEGLTHVNANGNPQPRTCNLRVRWRKDGTANWSSRTWDVTRAKIGAFTVLQRVDVSADPGIYEIEVTRLAPAYPEADLQDRSKSVWATVNEITYDDLSYPGVALIALEVASTDQIRGRIPTLTTVAKGSKVWVWDGLSTTSPNFTFEWSDNPAWCVLDMLLNPIYGLARGGRFTLDNIDLQSFQDWADLCDTTPNVNGAASTEKRATLGVVLTQEEDAWDVIQTIAEGAWAQIMVVGDQVSVILQTTQSDSALINTANVRDFVASREALSVRPNWIEVQFQNEDSDYTLDQVPAQDDTSLLTNNDPQLVETFRSIGVTRTVQAARLAQFRLNFARQSTKTVEFSAGPECIHLLPGDVIRVSHDGAGWGKSGRVRSSASTTITLDRPVVLSDGDKILVRTSGTGADALQERTVSVGGSDVSIAAGVAITVTSAWTGGDLPAVGDPWSAGASASYSERYRIRSIDTNQDLSRQVQAIEYDDALYDDDPGDVPTSTDFQPTSLDLPDDLTNVSVHEVAQVASDGSTRSVVEVHFRRARGWESVAAFYRTVNDDDEPGARDAWVYYGTVKGDRIALHDLPTSSTIEISVVPVSPAGVRRHPEGGSRVVYRMIGRSRKHPDLPSGIRSGQSGNAITLYLPVPDQLDVDGYEVRAGASWVVARRIAILPPGDHSLPLAGIGAQTILVRARNRSRAVSLSQESLSLTTASADFEAQDIDEDEESTSWSGTTTYTVPTDSSTVLELDVASALQGTYETPVRANGDAVDRTSHVRILVEPVLVAEDMTWDDAAFPWLSEQASVTWSTAYLTGFEAQEFETWDDAAFPWEGYVATLREWNGPADIAETMQTAVEFAYSTDGGSTFSDYERYIPREETFDSLQAKITLTTLHERLVPRVTSMRLTADYPDVAASGHTHDDRYYTEAELNAGQLDSRYFTESEHLNSSAGAGDAGKPVKLDADGHIDATMVNDGDIDHGSLAAASLNDDDHSAVYPARYPSTSARNYCKSAAAGAVTLTLQAHLSQTANIFAIDTAITPAAFNVDKNAKCTAYGFAASSQKITGVANGTASTDAINLGQLNSRCAPTITQGSSFPGSPTAGDIHVHTGTSFNYEVLVYDGSVWLGQGLLVIDAAVNANGLMSSQYMLGGPGNQSTQYRTNPMPWDAKLVKITSFLSGTVTDVDFILRRNGSNIATENRSGADTVPTGVSTVYDDDSFGEGDMAQWYMDIVGGSDSVNSPRVAAWFRRRES